MFSGFVFVGLIVQLAWGACTQEEGDDKCKTCGVTIGQEKYCSECNGANYAPVNGVCTDVSGQKEVCKTNAAGKCTGCAGESFMYKDGCYQTSQAPGQTMCKTAAGGKCTEAVESKAYFIPPGADDAHDSVVGCGDVDGVTLTGDKKYTGVAGCTTCDGTQLQVGASGATKCTACGDGKIVKTAKDQATSCVTEQACTDEEGFFVDAGERKCTACADEECAVCAAKEQKKCTRCKTSGTKKYLMKDGGSATGTCVDTAGCPATHYIDEEAKSCSTCVSGGTVDCTTCEKGAGGAVLCKTCATGAKTKFGPGKKSCVESCPSNSSEEKTPGTCECVEGYVPDEAGTGCKKSSDPPAAQCSTPGCKTCDKPKAGEEVCTECEGAKALTPTGQCIEKCGDLGGYYEGTNDKKKKACKKCEVANCLLCNQEGKCAACKAGFYGEACAACNSACKNCSGPTAADCTECSSGKALKYDTTGAKGTCEAGCKPNASGCEKCELTVEGTTYCSKCKEAGQFPQNGVCSAAAGRAVTCTSQGSGVCNTCANGLLHMNGGCYETAKFPGKSVCKEVAPGGDTCQTEAPGYHLDNNALVVCSAGCKTCSSNTVCTACMDGYAKTGNSCTKCAAGCATCQGAAATCDTCSTGYYKSKNACLLCTANNADNTITGVANCASCAPPSGDKGPVLCYLMKDGGSTNKGGLSTGAIAGIVVAVVIVVGGLVGFLCWWFMCRGKA
ncbi:VSP [Giardia lamblia P15]|uniref:VSP n=1 Tax=Giardia intestinalis (strain P15) TaxID=658858 RepID=E1F2L4_GIAIA|nr:VSP [Giardia lamblia P15]